MENIDKLNPKNKLVSAAFDDAPSMSRVKSSVAVLLHLLHALALENTYFYHRVLLPCKNVLKEIKFISNLKVRTDEIITLINKSLTYQHSS